MCTEIIGTERSMWLRIWIWIDPYVLISKNWQRSLCSQAQGLNRQCQLETHKIANKKTQILEYTNRNTNSGDWWRQARCLRMPLRGSKMDCLALLPSFLLKKIFQSQCIFPNCKMYLIKLQILFVKAELPPQAMHWPHYQLSAGSRTPRQTN